ncbi:MAG TPA: hypothetical protein DDX19_07695 [Rhodopirellula baltica]|nr:hypothetical protein [Rhodopirellula baltica]
MNLASTVPASMASNKPLTTASSPPALAVEGDAKLATAKPRAATHIRELIPKNEDWVQREKVWRFTVNILRISVQGEVMVGS